MRSVAILAILLLAFNFAHADGGVWVNRGAYWDLHPETTQYALIDFENDYERLGLTIEMDADLAVKKTVWMLPIPANPTTVEIELSEGFPLLYGTSITQEAQSVVGGAAWLAVGWGFFPLNLPLAFLFIIIGRGTISGAAMKTDGLSDSAYYSDISIFQRVTQGGVTSDLVATENAQELENYLRNKGIELTAEHKSMLSEYIGKKYSFVITYISDWQKFITRTAGQKGTIPISLLIKFPTTKPYFPLKLTSVYGDASIPVTIYMYGNYKPQFYGGVNGNVEYYTRGRVSNYYDNYRYRSENYDVRGNYIGPKISEEFFRPGRNLNNFEFTKIEMDVPSRNFKEDLWFEPGTGLKTGVQKTVAENFWFIALLFFIIVTMASSLIAGKLIFREEKMSDMRLAAQGLWSLLSMVGFVVATIFWKTRTLDEKTIKQLSAQGVGTFDKRKVTYAGIYYLLFLILTIVLWGILAVLLG
ncbi:MAG: hypothetical protein V1835_01745 [Candidatus Micrarchaeota archaeon]